MKKNKKEIIEEEKSKNRFKYFLKKVLEEPENRKEENKKEKKDLYHRVPYKSKRSKDNIHDTIEEKENVWKNVQKKKIMQLIQMMIKFVLIV